MPHTVSWGSVPFQWKGLSPNVRTAQAVQTFAPAPTFGIAQSEPATGKIPLFDKAVVENIVLIPGRSNIPLAQAIANCLGVPLTPLKLKEHGNQETYVQVGDDVRGRDAFVVQSTANQPNQNFMELFLMMDALKRGGAKSITAVIPSFGYARGDRLVQDGEALPARLMANLLQAAGATHVITLDLHSPQIVGFFDIPIQNLTMVPLTTDWIKKHAILQDVTIVSPDFGGGKRARKVAEIVNAPFAIVDKIRKQTGQAEVRDVYGEVKGRICVVVDDMVDSAGTMEETAKLLKERGAKSVYVMGTHGVFSPPALTRLGGPLFEEVVVSDSEQSATEAKAILGDKLTVVTVAPLLAQSIGEWAQAHRRRLNHWA